MYKLIVLAVVLAVAYSAPTYPILSAGPAAVSYSSSYVEHAPSLKVVYPHAAPLLKTYHEPLYVSPVVSHIPIASKSYHGPIAPLIPSVYKSPLLYAPAYH